MSTYKSMNISNKFIAKKSFFGFIKLKINGWEYNNKSRKKIVLVMHVVIHKTRFVAMNVNISKRAWLPIHFKWKRTYFFIMLKKQLFKLSSNKSDLLSCLLLSRVLTKYYSNELSFNESGLWISFRNSQHKILQLIIRFRN